MRKYLLPLIALLLPGIAHAQANQCRLPEIIARPQVEGPSADEPKRVLPIGYYTLAVSWSPQYCKTSRGGARDAFQCGSGNDFGFTLHGLWPDGVGKDWPQYCHDAEFVPPPVIRAHLCTTPSAQLLQHEWAKHGSCMAPTPERYYRVSGILWRSLRWPDADRLSRQAGALPRRLDHCHLSFRNCSTKELGYDAVLI